MGETPLGPVWAPCRAVRAETGPDRAGFGYGTLPRHPGCGEKACCGCRRHSCPDGQVALTVVAYQPPGRPGPAPAAPAAWYARVVGPLPRLFQRCYARRCGRSLRAVFASRP
ncbi:DUF1990 family protein [Streptomyces sp. NPDC002851]